MAAYVAKVIYRAAVAETLDRVSFFGLVTSDSIDVIKIVRDFRTYRNASVQ